MKGALLQIIDLKDRHRPRHLSAIRTGNVIDHFVVGDEVVYIAESEGDVHVYDISDPRNLKKASTPIIQSFFERNDLGTPIGHHRAFRYVGCI